MERHRGVSPCGSALFRGRNVSQHLRNGALRTPRARCSFPQVMPLKEKALFPWATFPYGSLRGGE